MPQADAHAIVRKFRNTIRSITEELSPLIRAVAVHEARELESPDRYVLKFGREHPGHQVKQLRRTTKWQGWAAIVSPTASRPTLDSPPCSVARLQPNTFEPLKTMGKQYNKVIKKKRHIAYLKRKKAAVKKTAKPAKK